MRRYIRVGEENAIDFEISIDINYAYLVLGFPLHRLATIWM